MHNHRYFIHLAYLGTNYFGWQKQPNQISVQEVIEKALTQLNSNAKVEITGCGRTDTGVHAKNYYAHFDSIHELDVVVYRHKLNNMLPDDIAVFQVIKVEPTSHARFDATSRTYEYEIILSKNPFKSKTAFVFNQPVNIIEINKACELIKSYTDFECFSKVHTEVNNFNCEIYSIRWEQTADGYLFAISANRFLRNMVRAIVGTLLDIGQEKITLDDLEKILQSKNRSAAGQSVPAHGLSLVQIKYYYLS